MEGRDAYARPRVIRGTRVKPLPLLPSGPGGVCSRPLHEARSLTTYYASSFDYSSGTSRNRWSSTRSISETQPTHRPVYNNRRRDQVEWASRENTPCGYDIFSRCTVQCQSCSVPQPKQSDSRSPAPRAHIIPPAQETPYG